MLDSGRSDATRFIEDLPYACLALAVSTSSADGCESAMILRGGNERDAKRGNLNEK